MWWLEKARAAARDGVSKAATVEVGAPSGPVRNIVVDVKVDSDAGDAAAAVIEDESEETASTAICFVGLRGGRAGGRRVGR